MKHLTTCILILSIAGWAAAGSAKTTLVVSLDGTRTGDELEAGGHRYLTSPIMSDATNILLSAGFTISTAPDFLAAHTAGAGVLYTGAVNVGFSAAEITNVVNFVNGGGGLVIERDWNGFYVAADPLLAAFGVTIDTSAVGPASTPNPVVDVTGGTHPIWNGPAGRVTSFDQVYSSSIVSGATVIGRHTNAVGPAALGVLTVGLGNVIVLTDMDAWDNPSPPSMAPGSNNAIVWENIFHFAAPVPEPSSLVLSAFGFIGLAACGWRRRKRSH